MSRVVFMESTRVIVRRYGTQPVMKLGLNQLIMREVFEKLLKPTESDRLTESVTEDNAEESTFVIDNL